jgi:hypothetical protein
MTRRTQFAGSASGRRRERRAHLQSEASVSAEVLHRPTPGRVTLQLQRKPADRVTKAIEVQTTKTYDSLSNCCLPNVAIFSVKSKNKESLTARA